MKRSPQNLGRVRCPERYPRERLVLGELHLLRGRLDGVLSNLAELISVEQSADMDWLRVEEAARLARRALAAAVRAAPRLEPRPAGAGELVVGVLRVDTFGRRQWYGEVEFELSPLHHRLLAVMAADPYREFATSELLREVWRRPQGRAAAVKTSVGRVRRALVAAGAPAGSFMLSLHAAGWALTRPE